MTNQIKRLREKHGLTQSQLAEETKLSLRTIQRIEASRNLPKGHTLKCLEDFFHEKFDHENLSLSEDALSKIKLVNFSVLLFVILPLLHLGISIAVWKRHSKIPLVNALARPIVNFQLQWSALYVFLIVITSIIQGTQNIETPIILFVMLGLIGFNLVVVVLTANSLSRHRQLPPIVQNRIQLI